MFKPVSPKVSFPKLEEEILSFWREKHIFERSLQKNEGNDQFVLYEGPPTANGSPGIHHVLARVFKDLFPRYKTMRGYYTPRKGGWDTHGLPVELEVEKELKLTTKHQVEDYGIAAFNEKCRASVFRYVKNWETMTERIAFWVDLKDAYVTYSNEYIESEWWILKRLWDQGLVYQGHKVPWHCPRCETTLSSHEVAQGYEDNTSDPSVYVRFEIDTDFDDKEKLGEKPWDTKDPLYDVKQELTAFGRPAYLLAWTTTPWTLPGNVALAVDPEAEYSLITLAGEEKKEAGRNEGTTSHPHPSPLPQERGNTTPTTGQERGHLAGDVLVLASARLKDAIKGEYTVHAKFNGKDLAGLRYKPLYDPRNRGFTLSRFHNKQLRSVTPNEKITFAVQAGDFVTMDDGTGIVHIAPAFGQDDYNLGSANNLLFVQHVDLSGHIVGDYPFKGKFFKEADPIITKELQERGLMYRAERMKHTYPFCWRCKSPLINYAKASWYVRTSSLKDKLIEGNEQINWYPDHIKRGRFGEWLANNVDWAISRERYWGTPIPIWQCTNAKCNHQVCMGSVQELSMNAVGSNKRPLDKDGKLDIHKPWIDDIKLKCEKCGNDMERIPEVLDAWFDSGAMPYAQWHYPFENKEKIESADPKKSYFPADYICEAVDQTRGWFYSLHALSTLLFGKPSYENVICLGLILDAKGEKMSKSKGNIVEPFSVINTYGADATRWYLYTASPPGNPRRFSAELVQEGVRQFVLPLWNVYSFFVTYANIDKFTPWLRLSDEAVKAAGIEGKLGVEAHRDLKKWLSSRDREAWTENPLDIWLVSETQSLIEDVTTALENYDPTVAGRRIEKFVDALSDWYVRRGRRRFWKSENDYDKVGAYYTLYDALVTLSRLLAPFTPFLADELYRNLVSQLDSKAPESVHLASWPEADKSLVDNDSLLYTRLAMQVSSLGRAARNKASIKVRQPLPAVLVKVPNNIPIGRFPNVLGQILEELNAKKLVILEDETQVAEVKVKPNLPVMGPKYGQRLSEIVKLINSWNFMESGDIRKTKPGEKIKLGEFELDAEDFLISLVDKPGYATSADGDVLVAVETKLTPELVDEGIARELVHRIQTMRKSAGYEIEDHIVTTYDGGAAVQRVAEKYRGYIMQETLSNDLKAGKPEQGAFSETGKLDTEEVTLGTKKI